MPERKVRDLIDAEEKSIEAMRSAGFTATQVVPEGGMFPGSGAVIILDGKSADEMVLKRGTAVFSQLVEGDKGLSGNYYWGDGQVARTLQASYICYAT
ncbi:MAG: hypothetical protein R3B93_24050 [Bacteroidia bacterium]